MLMINHCEFFQIFCCDSKGALKAFGNAIFPMCILNGGNYGISLYFVLFFISRRSSLKIWKNLSNLYSYWKITMNFSDFFDVVYGLKKLTFLVTLNTYSLALKNTKLLLWNKGRPGRFEALCFTDTLRFLLLTFKEFEKVFRKTGNARPSKMNKRSCKKNLRFFG